MAAGGLEAFEKNGEGLREGRSPSLTAAWVVGYAPGAARRDHRDAAGRADEARDKPRSSRRAVGATRATRRQRRGRTSAGVAPTTRARWFPCTWHSAACTKFLRAVTRSHSFQGIVALRNVSAMSGQMCQRCVALCLQPALNTSRRQDDSFEPVPAEARHYAAARRISSTLAGEMSPLSPSFTAPRACRRRATSVAVSIVTP